MGDIVGSVLVCALASGRLGERERERGRGGNRRRGVRRS